MGKKSEKPRGTASGSRSPNNRHAEAVSHSKIVLADNKGKLTDGRDDKDKGPKRGKSVGK